MNNLRLGIFYAGGGFIKLKNRFIVIGDAAIEMRLKLSFEVITVGGENRCGSQCRDSTISPLFR